MPLKKKPNWKNKTDTGKPVNTKNVKTWKQRTRKSIGYKGEGKDIGGGNLYTQAGDREAIMPKGKHGVYYEPIQKATSTKKAMKLLYYYARNGATVNSKKVKKLLERKPELRKYWEQIPKK